MGLTPIAAENTINAINAETGEVRFIAELGTYETEFNPDGTDINPNLYGMDITPEGVIYVADAGGNAIYQVNADGTFTLFAVVPDLTALTGAEVDPEMGARQAVPTSVVIDDGGYINVGLLGEGWDGPSILAYASDATYTEGVSGIPVLVSMALGPDGLMYATSLTADFSGEMPAPGNVLPDQCRRGRRTRGGGIALPARHHLRSRGEPLRHGQLDHLRPRRPARAGAPVRWHRQLTAQEWCGRSLRHSCPPAFTNRKASPCLSYAEHPPAASAC
jgi:hypothetical protein